MSDKPKRGNYIVQAWLVIFLALLYGSALAGVHVGLSGRIEENIRNEIYDQIPGLVSDAVKEKIKEHSVEGANGKTSVVYEALDKDGRRVGWVLRGYGQGFADRIDLLIGLDPEMSTITGMYVLGQKETPGLGDYITEGKRFRDQFPGKQVDPPLEVVQSNADEHQIQSLTGATISSESVSDIVNKTIANLKKPVLEL